MSRFWRNLLCICVGMVLGYVGFLIVVTFWPLLFPEALQGPTRGEDALLIVVILAFLSFFLTGFLLCRRLTKRFIRDKDGFTVLFR